MIESFVYHKGVNENMGNLMIYCIKTDSRRKLEIDKIITWWKVVGRCEVSERKRGQERGLLTLDVK